jgi:predicted nuclease of predicted toxin-antitoxin system
MRILFDECVPWPMHRLIPDHECVTVQQCGWGGIKNGELLRLAELEFALFITSDQSLRYQQNLTDRTISIIQLSTNKLRPILASAAIIQAAVAEVKPGEFRKLQIP